MKQIVVDIVLLPEQTVSNWAIEINRTLIQQGNAEIQLHPQNCLPHISLAMGCLNHKDIPVLGSLLTTTWQQQPVTVLESYGVVITNNSQGGFISSLALNLTTPLQQLHEHVMHISAAYLHYDCIESHMFAGDHSIAESAIQWVSAYPRKSSFQYFQPHITLGFGTLYTNTYPETFASSALAICHLGNHCTCREVLWSLDMKTKDH